MRWGEALSRGGGMRFMGIEGRPYTIDAFENWTSTIWCITHT